MTTGDGSSTGQPGGGAADATGGNPARDADAARNIGRPASNFAFLQGEWPALYDEALHAERLAHADPRAACFYARRTLELAVHWMYQADAATLHRPTSLG